jgi:F0F1-type ATP synthase assembly protein I
MSKDRQSGHSPVVLFGFASQFIGELAACTVLGWWIDHTFGTAPRAIAIGGVVGFVVGFVMLLRNLNSRPRRE